MMSDEGLKILHILVHQYSNLNKSLYCGSMLRECLHYKNLSLLFLNNSKLLNHLIYVYPSSECRELRIDVMYTIRVLLLSNTDSWEKKHFQIVDFMILYILSYRHYKVLLNYLVLSILVCKNSVWM